MGRKLIYYCDSCSDVLSDGVIQKNHISINLSGRSGWVAPDEDGEWNHTSTERGIFQFCKPKCLADYFKNLKK